MILDIITDKNGDVYIVKYDLLKSSYERLYLSDDNYRCLNYFVNDDKAYLLFIEKCFKNKTKPKCIHFEIDCKKMEIKKESSFSLQHSFYPLALVSVSCILTQNKEIVDIKTQEKHPTILKEYFKNNDTGYKYKIIPSADGKLILVYSKEVLVYSKKEDKITDIFKAENCGCCSYADIIDNKLYVGTWSGLFVASP